MRGKVSTLLVMSIIFSLLMAACAPAKPTATPTPARPTQAPTAVPPTSTPTPKVIKIGGLYPLTGAYAAFGEGDKRAIDLALEEINAAGGVKSLGGAKIEIVYADTQGDPKVALTEAERLITQEKVVAILGSILSSTTATSAEVAEKYKIPYVNEGSTSVTLTEHGWKYFFRCTPHDGFYCEEQLKLLKYLEEKSGVKVKTLGLMYENTLFGKTAGDMWKQLADKYGYQIVVDIPYDAKVADLSSEITSLKAAAPDVVFLASYTQDAILITKTMKQMDFNAKAVMALDGGQILPAYVEAVGDLGNFIFAEARWNADLGKPITQEVNRKYKERYGVNMDGHNTRAHTAAYVLYYALEKAGSTDPEKLREALATIEVPGDKIIMGWDGVKFDEKGQNILGRGCIVQMFNKEYKTVWPLSVKTADAVFPVPRWDER